MVLSYHTFLFCIMKEHFDNVISILKERDLNGCITGSVLLEIFNDNQQDVDVFLYDEQSFIALLYFMHYDPRFNILDKQELHKFEEYTKYNKSSLDKLGLVTIKFKYNLLIDVNVIYKRHHKDIFSVLSNFDLDIITTGYDLKTGKTLSLRESTGKTGTWNKWNTSFYKGDFWSVKRLLRQFERVIKYTNRGYDLSSVTDKYISIVEEIINTENYYKSEKGIQFFEDTIEEFEVVLKILQSWKKDQKITPEELLKLKTLI